MTTLPNLLALLGKLRPYKVTKWDEDSSVTYSLEEREQAPSLFDANVATSLIEGRTVNGEQAHALLLDLDLPAHLVPSSTEGHSHLYVDVAIPEGAYFRLLRALAEVGVIQSGYAESSIRRGGTALRLPWIKKPAPAPAPTTDPF